MRTIPPAVCQRTRAYVSLGLDGELAELERRMLDSHLPGCEACREYAADVEAITDTVRATPPLGYAAAAVASRFRAARAGRLRQISAVAAGVMVFVGAGSVVDRGPPATSGADTSASPEATRVYPTPRLYLSETALREEQSLMALTRPGSPLPQLRF